jgi:hypothetical protein
MNQPNGSADASTGITYPEIIIDGTAYKLKFGMGAMFRLEKYGLDPSQVRDMIIGESNAGRKTQLTFKLLAACLGNEGTGGRWKPAGFDPEALADMLSPQETELVAQKIIAAMVKAPPEGEATAQTQPATPAPIQ